jgi:uncharacterized protein (DUF2336 family)
MTEAFSIDGLMQAARDRSPQGRSRLFHLLGQLFLARGAAVGENERRGFAELLALLRPLADAETRLELAHETAEAPFAPLELAKLLGEDEIEIASLVLFKAEALGTADLLALAEDAERAAIIAGRRGLPMVVADALMRRGDPEIARALLKNETIKLSIPALDDAIELSRSDPDLQRRIAARPELLEEMAIEMAAWAEAPVSALLVERFQLASESTTGDALAAQLRTLLSLGIETGPLPERDFAAIAEAAAPPQAVSSEAQRREAGPRPDPRFRLSPRLVVETLRRGERAQAEAMFAQMAALPMDLVRRFAKERDGESIAVAARAIGMAREEFATIYLLWKKAQSRDGLVAAAELGTALDLFDTIPQDRVAARVVEWRQSAHILSA